MSDITAPEIKLNFETVPETVKIHENWLSGKLHEMTMKSESGIKWETMGKDFKAKLEDISGSSLHAMLAWQAVGIGEAADRILPIRSFRDLGPMIETTFRASMLFATIGVTNFFNYLGERMDKMTEKRSKEIQQKMTEVLKRTQMTK